MLCRFCQNIHFKPWQQLTEDERLIIIRSSDEENEYGEENEDPEDDNMTYGFNNDRMFYIHHQNLAALKKSA